MLLFPAPDYPGQHGDLRSLCSGAVGDHNLVSASKIVISVTADEPWIVTIDATNASIPNRFDVTLPQLIKLTSEAIEKTARDWKIFSYKIEVKGGDKVQ